MQSTNWAAGEAPTDCKHLSALNCDPQPTRQPIDSFRVDSTTKRSFLDAKGVRVTDTLAKRIKSRTKTADFKYPSHVVERSENLKPIVMVFSVDTRLTDSGVVAYLLSSKEPETPSRSWMTGSNDGILTSFVMAPNDWDEWPEDTQLEIRFADENPQVVDHFEGEVDKKIELAGGIFL